MKEQTGRERIEGVVVGSSLAEARNLHASYLRALDAWERLLEEEGGTHKLVVWSLIRREIDDAVRRHVEDQATPTISWDNVKWLLAPDQLPSLSDVEDALSVEVASIDGERWYDSFYVDEEDVANLVEENATESRSITQMVESYRTFPDEITDGNDEFCSFVEYGQMVAVARVQIEYCAREFRNYVFFNGAESDDNFTIEEDKEHPIWVQQNFQRLPFEAQVTVAENLTFRLEESRVGREMLVRMADPGFRHSFNPLCFFDSDRRSSQTTYANDGVDGFVPLVREPSDGVASKTFADSDGALILTGSGKSDDLFAIANRLLLALSEYVGDRGRTIGRDEDEAIVDRTMTTLSCVVGSIAGAMVPPTALANGDGWGDASAAMSRLETMRKGEWKRLPDSSSSPPIDAAIEEAMAVHAHLSELSEVVENVDDLTDRLPSSVNWANSSAGLTLAALNGVFFVYQVAFGDGDPIDEGKLEPVESIVTSYKIYESVEGAGQDFADFAAEYTKERGSKEFLSAMSDADHKTRFHSKNVGFPKAVGSIVDIVDAGLTAYQSYRLFRTGDDVAGYLAAGIAGVSTVSAVVSIASPSFVTPLTAALALVVIVASIVLAHVTSGPVESWMKNTVFGSEFDDRSGDDFHDPSDQWFLYDDGQEGGVRQISEYLNLRMGFEVTRAKVADTGNGLLWLEELMFGSPDSRIFVRPIKTSNDASTGPTVGEAIHSIPAPPDPDRDLEPFDVPGEAFTVERTENTVSGRLESPPEWVGENSVYSSLKLLFEGGDPNDYFIGDELQTDVDGYDDPRYWGVEVLHAPPGVLDKLASIVSEAVEDDVLEWQFQKAVSGTMPLPRVRVEVTDER